MKDEIYPHPADLDTNTKLVEFANQLLHIHEVPELRMSSRRRQVAIDTREKLLTELLLAAGEMKRLELLEEQSTQGRPNRKKKR